jgi:uncharacterized repeat protein (TIGR01451 family)
MKGLGWFGHTFHRGAAAIVTALMLASLLAPGATPAHAQSFTFPLNETFMGSTASGWVLGGTSVLTSDNGDPAGNGWLRLTSSGTYQAGYAYYNTPIPTGRGMIVTFDYGAWGGTGADGLTFFLFDGTTTPFKVGASGGSLGYAQKTGVNGLSGGYLGLGLDEFGNYSNPNEGRVGGTGFVKNAVAVRGPGSGTTGYAYLAGTTDLTKAPWNLPRLDCPKNFVGLTNIGVTNGICGTGATRPASSVYYRQVRITVTPVASAYSVLAEIKFGPSDSWRTLFGPFTMPTSAPGTLKMGFAGSTGGSTNYHEIRNLAVTQQVPDLTATKAVQNATTGGGSVAPSEQLLYTVVLKNNTSTVISDVSFTDTIPTYTTYVANSATTTAGTAAYSSGSPPTLNVTGITVPGNGQATVTFRVQVNDTLPAGVTQISNQGSFTYNSTTSQTDGDTVTSGDQPTVISVTAGPNFDTATKTVSVFTDTTPVGDVSPGDTLLYRVVVPNTGNQDSPTTSFTDTLPSNTTYLAGSAAVSGGTVTYNSTTKTLSWTASVNAGSQATLEFKVTVNSGVKIRDVISNQGTVTYGATSVLTDADLSTPGKQPAVLLVGGNATLTATKAASIFSPPLQPSGQVEYTVVLANTGSYAVSGATFVDTMPANTTYVADSATTTSGAVAYSDATRTLNVTGISLASGATVTIKFKGQVNNPLPTGVTQISNQGVASWDANNSGANNTTLQTDGDPATAGQQPTVNTITNADLVATKSLDNDNPAEAGAVAYTVRVTNNGPTAVTSASVADALPAGLTFVSASASQGSYASDVWTIGALANGDSATLIINATANLGQGGSTITNNASVSSELYDAYPANNTTSAGLTVKTTALTGVITDAATGLPLSGVTVKVTDSQSHTCTFATTGGDGAYAFTSGVSGCLLAPDAATVETTAAPSGYLMASASKTIVAGVTNIQDLTLVRPSLSGVVIELGAGVPLVGATVTLTQGANTCTTTTGAGGAYSFVAGTGSPTCNFTAGAATVSAAQTNYQSATAYPAILSTGPTTQNLPLSTADLLITKTDGQTVAQPGETLNYVITIVNNGTLTANSVTLTDTLPTYLSYKSWATNDSEIEVGSSANPYTWALGNLAAGASKSITLTAMVTTSLPNGTTALSNYANVSTISPEANTTNNERADANTVTAHPDLTLLKSATSDSVPITAGSTITYTYNGDNRGSATATGVIITDTLDANTTYVAGSAVLVVWETTWPVAATYTDSSKTLVLQLPDMPPGAAGYLRYKATVIGTLPPGTTLITNTAQVTSNETDLDPANNQSTLVLSAISGADVYVDKLSVPAANPAVPGSKIVYLLRYGNLGNQVASSAVLTDVVPDNTTLVTDSITGGGSYASDTRTITWSLGSLAVNASGQVSFTVRITDLLTTGVDHITNTAQIASDVYDPVSSSNQSTAATSVVAAPDLVIRKSHSGVYFEANQTITYTLIYSNTGNQTATGVVITDTLDDQLTYIGSHPAGNQIATRTITWNIGALPVDGPHTIVVTATVSALASGELTINRAEIGDNGDNGPDPDPVSNSANDIVQVARPILILEKSAAGQSYVTGQLTYTVIYRNNGPVPARSVVINDLLPADTTLVAGSITGGGSYDSGTRTITWSLGNLAVGASGQVSFTVTVGAGAGGATQSAATVSSESASDSQVITSTTAAETSPWCNSAGCSTIRGYWGGANPVGPAGWEANPQLPDAAFNDSTWTTLTAPGAIEPYWMDAANLGAAWVAVTNTMFYTQNYSFFRQYFYLPPNARGFAGSLQIAGDDIVDVYVNGRFIGTHYGSGGASSMSVSSALLAGVNLLAVRLTNNTHNGHDIYSGGDHPGLLYHLEASFERLIPFTAAPAMTLKDQSVAFTMQDWLRGKLPFSYTISFGDSQSADYTTDTSIPHTYTTPNIYTATVTARDQLGSVATDTLTITVLDSSGILLANRATTGYQNVVGVGYTGETGVGVELHPAADLSIVKTVEAGGTTPGQDVRYKLLVTNNGPDAVTGAAVTDTVPAAVTGVTWTCTSSGGSCAHASDSGNSLNETVNLPSGATATYTIQGTISPAATGALANAATIAAPSGVTDPVPDNNSSAVSTDLTPSVNLSISKVSSPKPGLAPGGGVSYNIVVTNSGPSEAADVAVTDVFTAALTGVTWTCAAGSGSTCAASGSGDISDMATIAAGGSVAYTVRGTVVVGAAVGATITNTVTATYDICPMTATDNNTLIAWTTLIATKDALDSTNASSRSVPFVDADGNGGISPGDTLKYKIIVANNSANIAYNITHNDSLDANTALVVGSVSCDPACTVTQGNVSGDTAVGVSIASIAGNDSVTIYYQATVKATLPFQLATLSNQGQVGSSNAPALATDDPATTESGDPTVLTLTMGAIGGIAWRDDNNDGIKDTNEPVLANVTVRLYYAGVDGLWNTGDDQLVYGRTNASGAYNFSNLAAGKYQVGFSQLEGFAFSQVYGEGKDSKADPSTGLTAELTLTANQQMTGISAGLASQMDFGNLPASYAATTLTDDGARHVVAGTLYLGTVILAENDGAEGTPADNDGITPPSKGGWKAGETDSLIVKASDSGRLWAWFDWNHDGDFADENEAVDLGTVITGDQAVTLTIPSGFTEAQGLYARFRLYPADYAQEFTPYGMVSGGEVEDYLFDFPTPTRVIVSRFDAVIQNGRVVIEWETAAEDNTAGFFLYRQDAGGQLTRVNEQIVPAFLGASIGGTYRLLDRGPAPGGASAYTLEEIETGGQSGRYGPFKVTAGRPATTALPVGDGVAYERMRRPAALDRQPSGPEPNASTDVPKAPPETQTASPLKRADWPLRTWLPLVTRAPNAGVVAGKARLTVRTSGLYYLAAEDIAPALGLDVSQVTRLIQTNQLALTNQGQAVAYLAASGNAGIYFYGQGIASPYTADNVYWLAQAKGLLMDALKHPIVPPAVPLTPFPATSHAEQNLQPAPGLFHDPAADYWVWDYLVAGDATHSRKSFVIRADGAARTDATSLTARFLGVTASDAGADHHARVILNGAVIGDAIWTGAAPYEITLPVGPTLLRDGANTIEVIGLLDAGVPYSIFYVNAFDLSYQRYTRALNEVLVFPSMNDTAATIYGFSNNNIMVFDLSNPAAPARVTAVSVEAWEGAYRVAFKPAAANVLHLAIATTAVPRITTLAGDVPSNLKGPNAADYVIVTTASLVRPAETLATYRQGQGLRAKVVDVQDIYDEFNGGVASPQALRDFLAYAYANWRPAPRYVLLAGAGSYDYKNYQGYGDSLTPPIMVGTPKGLVAADSRYGDVAGDDGAPEIAVGRLPVLTAAEFAAYVAKIRAYEAADPTGWSRQALLLADNTDPKAGNFAADSDLLASSLPAGYTAQKIYLGPLTKDQARSQILTQLAAGAGIFSYIGHGGLDTLADEKLLVNADVATLHNSPRLPFMSAASCVVGNYAFPGNRTLGVLLTLQTDGGSAAVFSPTGPSLNADGVALEQALFRALFAGSSIRVGDATRAALFVFAAGGPRYALDTFNLLGDPAMVMKWR